MALNKDKVVGDKINLQTRLNNDNVLVINIFVILIYKNMEKHLRQFRKEVAFEMRRKGFSYSEIENATSIPRSTLAYWFRGIKLTELQIKKLTERRLEALRAGAQKKMTHTTQMIEEIKNTSADTIKNISKRELWLMGTMLYWRERMRHGSDNDIRRGVRFASSDPYLIKLFLLWLKDIGNLADSELRFDIFLKNNEKRQTATEVQSFRNSAIDYWSQVTNFSINRFNHIYFQKYKIGKTKRTSESKFGFLRIRVRSSSLLARQIAGWIRGIQKFYWGNETWEDRMGR